jgi:type III restriction enzyme
MANNSTKFIEDFAFYEQLWFYYTTNRGKIRSRYNDLTKKFLAYNDKKETPEAFLRTPQFEALEMYVFIKEFMGNPQVHEMFDDWRKRQNKFSDRSYYTVHKGGQGSMMDMGDEQNEIIFKQMKKYREKYPNYIYALTMGLGKTILMATCIFYEFLLAKKYPQDKRFCHNALVFAPDKTVLESLREIMTFDKTKVVPPEYANVLDSNIKFHFLEESGITLHTIDDSDFNIIISNNQKIIVKKKRKADKPADVLFGSGSLLADVYSGDNEDDDDVWDDATLMDNQRFKKLCRLPQLGVYVDEAHHLFGANLEKELRSGSGNKTTLRNTINMLAEATSIVACYNYTGTPYVNKQVLPEVVYAYGLNESIVNGFLKDADPIGFDNVKNEEFINKVITMFWERYGGKTYEGLPPKLAIFAAGVTEATDVVRPMVEKVLSQLNIPLNTILVNTGDSTVTKDDDIHNFNNLDVIGTEGSKKQFIILVEKGREGWNCRSLLGIALFRSPSSKIFVLQATMRCLRKLTDEQLMASVFLSKENYDILNDELKKNYDMEITELGKTSAKKISTPIRFVFFRRQEVFV